SLGARATAACESPSAPTVTPPPRSPTSNSRSGLPERLACLTRSSTIRSATARARASSRLARNASADFALVIHYRARYVLPTTSAPIADGVVAVDGGRIVYVGPAHAGLAHAGPSAEVMNLGDALLLPGL